MALIITYFKNLKFRKKLFISYIIVSIIPIIVLGCFSYYQANTFLRKQATQSLSESIRQVSDNISFRCKQYELVINSVTGNFKFQEIFSDNYKDNVVISQKYKTSSNLDVLLYSDYVDPFFNNIRNLYQDILQITIFSPNALLQRGEYVLPITLVKDRPWYKESIKSPEVQWLGDNGRVICTKLFSNNYIESKTDPALIFLSIDSDNLFKDIDNLNAHSYSIHIINNDKKTVLSKSKNCDLQFDINTMGISNENGSQVMVGGKKYILVKANIAETNWILYYYTPVNEIAINALSIISITVTIIFICIISLAILIWLFTNTFVKRINRLNKKMKMVEDGNMRLEVSSNSKDEIGELTNRFGKMLNNINQLIDEVYHSKIIQKEAEMRALQAQINPHFLYNTLSIINWKAIEIDAIEISQITTAVSKFYRTVLNKGKNDIAIKDEVENIKAYIQIQSIMHNYNFDFICDIDYEIYMYDMINIVLQPIVENALEHGIDRKRGDRGLLVLRGYFAGENIEFLIEDNGPGMSAEVIGEALSNNSKGYGVKNVHERIKIFFGDNYGLKISSQEGKGTRVIVSLPKYQKSSTLNDKALGSTER